MEKIIFFGIILAVIGTAMRLLDTKLSPHKQQRYVSPTYPLSYNHKKYFFSPSERKFYEALKDISKELDYEVFAKVRWADIVHPVGTKKMWWSNWGKIKSKHVDFLLCEKINYTPTIAIEIDGPSHMSPKIKYRDSLESKIFNMSNIKLLRFKNKETYSSKEIKAVIENISTKIHT